MPRLLIMVSHVRRKNGDLTLSTTLPIIEVMCMFRTF